MTAFQWDAVLTKHLLEKLEETDAGLVWPRIMTDYFVHEELRDWEQEDFVRVQPRGSSRVDSAAGVPILLNVNVGRWGQMHPVLVQMTYEAVDAGWSVTRPEGRWMAREDVAGRRQVTLPDLMEDQAEVAVPRVR